MAASGDGPLELGRWERYDRRVLAGALRLPAARSQQLAELLGMDATGVREALVRLAQRGWAEEETISTEREDAVAVWLPSEAARAAYRAAGVDMDLLPLGSQHLERLLWDGTGALATATIIARLAKGARERKLRVMEACRLRGGIEGAIFAGAQGMVLVAGDDWCTPIFVLVDRQERTAKGRQELARAWTRLVAEMPVMAGAMMLVVTPTCEEMDQWDLYLSSSRGRRGAPRPPVYMATAEALSRPWEAQWARTEGGGEVRLYASLHRLGQVPLSLPLPFRGARAPVLPAPVPPGSRQAGDRTRRVGAGRRRILVTVLRHPGCTCDEVAALAGTGAEETRRVLADLQKGGYVSGVEGRWTATAEGERLGRRLLGVSPAARRPFPGPSFLPHQLELRAFLARLAAEARRAGGQVVALREAPLTAREFHDGGQARKLVPDASAAVAIGGRMLHLLVEWDRGSAGNGRWQQKLAAYAGYYRHLLRHGQALYWPLLLVVAPDGTREEAIGSVAEQVMPGGLQRLVLTTNSLLLESRGVLGPAWRRIGSGTRAAIWPED